MTIYPIEDYDDAYANSAHIEGSDVYPRLWQERAAAFRAGLEREERSRTDIGYGPGERCRYDLFMPAGAARGLVVFVHGGYWKAFDKSSWSHLATGPLAHGFAVAMPSYPLCPDARIGAIAKIVAGAVERAADAVEGPLILSGHSAGGHLVTRLVSGGSLLSRPVLERVRHVLSISGVHDLRPLLKTTMNETLRLDAAEADAESPLLLAPEGARRITCWVGADERPEFVRQNRALAEVWRGFAVRVECVEENGRHHYSVIDGLSDPNHDLTRRLVAG